MKTFLVGLFLSILLTGCAEFNHKLVDWSDHTLVRNVDGRYVNLYGNPRISCYNKYDVLVADGIFVRVENDQNDTYLVIDEFGNDYVKVKNDHQNYCILWERK